MFFFPKSAGHSNWRNSLAVYLVHRSECSSFNNIAPINLMGAEFWKLMQEN